MEVKLSEESVQKYNELKNKGHKFVIFKFEDGVIDVKEEVEWETPYEYLVERIRGEYVACCCFVVYYWNSETGKCLLIQWAPDGASIKAKMAYGTALEQMKQMAAGADYKHVSELDELKYDELVDKFGSDSSA